MTTIHRNIQSDRRAFASMRDVWNAEIDKGKSIRIFGTDGNRLHPIQIDRTYRVGERAVYDSYNLFYTGAIVSITDKTVTIDASATGGTRKRLPLAVFFMRNRRPIEDIDAHNAVESQCI